ncbi:ArsR/SmtB family transcription factor [Paenirhodobacter populi]
MATDTQTLQRIADPAAIESPLAPDATHMARKAPQIVGLLKSLSHEGRLAILCHLAEAERTVTELERLLGLRQAAVSQQLARLRADGLVLARRNGKAIHYSLAEGPARQIIAELYRTCCAAH